MPTTAQLTAFAAACDASETATVALLAGHHRVVNGPQPPPFSSCGYAEEAEARRQREEDARPWLAEPELDWSEQQRRDEEEADCQRWVRDVEDHLDELQDDNEQAQHPGPPAGAGDGTDGVLAVRLRAARGQ
ncbi:hypothetical protein [Streptomyces toxytricini]|uniref:hypothetical protein n=1 Tax=Streptomyces toxytricini TaxID=67369 RepID=UPI003431E040